MKAILIDSKTRKVSEVDFDGKLPSIYRFLALGICYAVVHFLLKFW